MSLFLLNSAKNTTLFFKYFCYSNQIFSKYFVLYANIIYKYFLFQLTNNICQFIFHMQKDFFMIIIYLKLLENSFQHAPDMPLGYHLETLRIAASFVGSAK